MEIKSDKEIVTEISIYFKSWPGKPSHKGGNGKKFHEFYNYFIDRTAEKNIFYVLFGCPTVNYGPLSRG